MFTNRKAPVLVLALALATCLNAQAQNDRIIKVNNLYGCLLEYNVECPKTVLAIAIFETGWMECKNCSYQFNNLFGFRANHDYIRFKNTYECIAYLKNWQETFYDPWKEKHPSGTYYDYLVHVKYAHKNISNYIRTIKAIERIVSKNMLDDDINKPVPGIEPVFGLPVDTANIKK